MVSQESAQVAADEIVTQARAESDEQRDAQARPTHPLYRFAELEGLAPWQRANLLRESMAKADRQWSVVVACLAWLCASTGIWFLFVPPRLQSASFAFGLVLLLGLPFVVVRRMQVRRHLQELLRTLPNSVLQR
jgi:Flp pilus assembly protein TadB